jgi:hypothetical protein
LKNKFFNSNCSFCLNDVVNEGIVLRIESSPNKTTLKFKNPLFLLKESSERDNDETNIEEEN